MNVLRILVLGGSICRIGGFYVSGRLWEAQSMAFYVSGRLWEAQSIVFHVSGRLWEAHSVVFYVSGRLWEAHLYVFYVSRGGLGGYRFPGLNVAGGSGREEPYACGGKSLGGSGKLICEYFTCLGGSGRLNCTYFTCPGGSWRCQFLPALTARVGPLS